MASDERPGSPEDTPTERRSRADYKAMVAEWRARREQLEQDRRDRVERKKDSRQFLRNAGLALFLAVAFNNPASWVGAIWSWIKSHVSVH